LFNKKNSGYRERLRKSVKALDTYGLVMDRVKQANLNKPTHYANANNVSSAPLAITGLFCFFCSSIDL